MKKIIYAFCLICVSMSSVLAQWTQYSTGNSNIHSNDLLQVIVDDNDNVWMTMTDDPIFDDEFRGLQKFDGTNWTWYDTSNVANFPVPQQWSKNYVEMTYYDGKIYLVNSDFNPGIYEFDVTNETMTLHNSTTPRNEFRHILVDNNGLLYVSQLNSIQSFDGSTWTEYPLANGSNLLDMELDNSGNIWATTDADELQVFDGSNWQVETTLPFTPMDNHQNMGIDQNDNIWVSNGSPTQQMGEMAVWNGSTFSIHNYNSTGQNFRVVEQMVLDNDGNMRMDGIALFSYDGSVWGRFDETNSDNTIAQDRVIDIAIDNSNTKWIASYGLVKYTGGPGGVTSVSENNLDQTKIYPNPSKGKFNILTEKPVSKISVVNPLGQIVFDFNSTQGIKMIPVSIEFKESNVYTLLIYYKNGEVSSEKVIIQ